MLYETLSSAAATQLQMNLLWVLTLRLEWNRLKHPHNKLSERALILTVLGEVELTVSTLISNDVDLHVRWWGHCQSSTCTRAHLSDWQRRMQFKLTTYDSNPKASSSEKLTLSQSKTSKVGQMSFSKDFCLLFNISNSGSQEIHIKLMEQPTHPSQSELFHVMRGSVVRRTLRCWNTVLLLAQSLMSAVLVDWHWWTISRWQAFIPCKQSFRNSTLLVLSLHKYHEKLPRLHTLNDWSGWGMVMLLE